VRRFGSETSWVNAVAISPDGNFVLTGGEKARLWDLASGKEVQQYGGRSRDIRAVAFSPDGSFVLTGHGGPLADQNRSETLDYTACLWETLSGKQVRCFTGHSASVSAVAFSHDGRLALTGGEDRTARLWDVSTGREILCLKNHYGWVHSVAFSPDDSLIATAADDARIWDTQSGDLIWALMLQYAVFSARFSPDGKYLLTGGADKKAHQWDLTRRVEMNSFSGHSEFVVDAIYSHDGNFILSAGADSATVLSRASTGEQIGTILSFPDDTWAVLDSQYRFDTNDLERAGGLHWVSPAEGFTTYPLEVFMRQYYEPGLLPRLLAGEKLPPIPALSALNLVQPIVQIEGAEWENPILGLAKVTVKVARGTSPINGSHEVLSDVYDLRLFRNGQLVAGAPQTNPQLPSSNVPTGTSNSSSYLQSWRDRTKISLPASGEQLFSFSVQVPRKLDSREVSFAAYAFNGDRVKSPTSSRSLQIPTDLRPRKGNAYIITIGVDSIEGAPTLDLRFAASDARGLQRVVQDKLITSKNFDKIVSITLISNNNINHSSEGMATKNNLKAVLARLAGEQVDEHQEGEIPEAHLIERAQPEDLVLLTFSGHAYVDQRGVLYLLMADSGPYEGITKELDRRAVASDELAAWMRPIDAGDITLIVDAAHSGAILGTGFKPEPSADSALGQLAYDKGMRILTASTADQVAIEMAQVGHGLLTYALINLLQKDSFVDEKGNVLMDVWLAHAQRDIAHIFAELTSGTLGRQSIQQQPMLFDFSKSHVEHLREGKL
jgi:WD40 repeat protein